MTDLATAPVSETPAAAPAVTEAPEQQNHGTYVPGEQVATQSDDTESRARAMGWVPKEDYKGNPDNWRDAGEFVRRGEEILPIVQERNRDLTRKLNELEARLNQKDVEHQTNLKKIERMSEIALVRQREQLLGSYDQAMRQAAASADVDRYDQLSRDRDQAVSQFDNRIRETVAVQPQQQQPQAPPEVQAWVERNKSWFLGDEALNMEAQAVHMGLRKKHPFMSHEENLKEVERTIKQRYPEKFGIQTQQAAPSISYGAVEGGGSRRPSAGGGGKTASDLPAEARAAAERFVKQGIFKDVNEYARDYFAS